MPNNKKQNNTLENLTKRQASIINRGNRKISGNANSLMDEISSMTYGIQKTDKIDSLVDDFNSLMKHEIDDLNKSSNGDTTSFLTKLFSDNNKRVAATATTLEDIFDSNDGQLEAFLTEQYRNRMIKQADLHEVASQLTELKEAIGITRDAIISADVITGHMSRTLKIGDSDSNNNDNGHIPIIEQMEKKFNLQEKIKKFIIPRSLEYGEYYVYAIPYSKIFEDFSKEKRERKGAFSAYREYTEATHTVAETLNKKSFDNLYSEIMESVKGSDIYTRAKNDGSLKEKDIRDELNYYLGNVSINNASVPIPILEEGVNSLRNYYETYTEKTILESNDKFTPTFSKAMKGIDTGMYTSSFSSKKKNVDNFSNIHDCYVKLLDPMKLLPIEIMDECIGYYYIQEEDITPLAGILTSTMYYDKFDANRNENNVLSSIAETIVSSFDKKFLENNIKFKKLIVEAITYYKLNNRRIKFQFIPKEYIVPIKINCNEDGHGESILTDSLFYAKLYLMLLLFKMMTIIQNSNDQKINYIKQSGIDKNVINKIQDIARKKQERQITLTDMFSYTTLINKIGNGSEMYIPVGKSGERGIETEILSGQEVQINTEFMEMLKKGYITGTGVPDVLMNYINEADFAKTLELANNRFQGRVVSYQLDYNQQITNLYRQIARFSTTLPEELIDTLEFNFIQPKTSNMNITNDIINNFNSTLDMLVNLLFGQDGIDKPENIPKIKKFKQLYAKETLEMIDFDKIYALFNKANIEGTEEILNPFNKDNDEE